MPLSTWSAGWPGRVAVSCVSCGWGVLVKPLPDPVVRLGGGSAAVVVRTFVCYSQLAISFPGTPVCDLTCVSPTAPGRVRWIRLHRPRSLRIMLAFRLPLLRGIHFPVVMCMA